MLLKEFDHILFSFLLSDVFRHIDFGPDPDGSGRLSVFQLLCNPSYYLATTQFRHLELQVRTRWDVINDIILMNEFFLLN